MAGRAVAKKAEKNLPAEVVDDFFEGASDGYEGVGREDITLPRLKILQSLSPQINKRHDDYVEGAEVGQWMNDATKECFEEFPIVFAVYQRRHVEWVPIEKGGGLVRDHGTDASILNQCEQDPDNGAWMHGDNEVVVTGTWYGLHAETLSPVFLAMGKTHFTASKKLMSAVRDQKFFIEGKGFVPSPLHGRVWYLGTTMRSNDKGDWFVASGRPGEWIHELPNGHEILANVKAMREWVAEDRVVIDLSDDDSVTPTPSAEGAM